MPQGIERRTGEEDGGTQIITIPTHLKVQDTLFRFGQVKVTARQFVLLLAGGSLIYTLWIRTVWLETSFTVPGTGVHWSFVAVCCIVLLALAFGNIADRTLDIWFLLLLVYWLRPRVYVWSSLRREPELAQEDTDVGEDVTEEQEQKQYHEQRLQVQEEVLQ